MSGRKIEISEDEKRPNDLVHPGNAGFKEKLAPREPGEGMFFQKCACGGIHFRHAGYVQIAIPFIRGGGEKKVELADYRVMVCVKCRKAYAWIGEQMYDLTDRVDLDAWAKSEVELQRATGPGGEC